MSTQSFPQFSALPAELCIKIWTHASTSPSIIAFKAHDGRPFGLTDASRVARVCTESRDSVRATCQHMQYRCLIGNAFSTYLWIDFDNTIVYLENISYDYYTDRKGIRIAHLGHGVRHLAIRFLAGNSSGLTEFCKRLVVFPELETLVVLVEPPAGQDVRSLRDYRDLERLRRLIAGEIEGFGTREVDLDRGLKMWINERKNKSSRDPVVRIVASDVM
jgi:hypothetical protein